MTPGQRKTLAAWLTFGFVLACIVIGLTLALGGCAAPGSGGFQPVQSGHVVRQQVHEPANNEPEQGTRDAADARAHRGGGLFGYSLLGASHERSGADGADRQRGDDSTRRGIRAVPILGAASSGTHPAGADRALARPTETQEGGHDMLTIASGFSEWIASTLGTLWWTLLVAGAGYILGWSLGNPAKLVKRLFGRKG